MQGPDGARCGTLRKLSRPIEARFAPKAGVAFNALGNSLTCAERPEFRFGAVVFHRFFRAISGRKREQAFRLNLLGSRLGRRRTHLEHDVVSRHRIATNRSYAAMRLGARVIVVSEYRSKERFSAS